jgi:hypothetical protein
LFERFKVELREQLLSTFNEGLGRVDRGIGFTGRAPPEDEERRELSALRDVVAGLLEDTGACGSGQLAPLLLRLLYAGQLDP